MLVAPAATSSAPAPGSAAPTQRFTHAAASAPGRRVGDASNRHRPPSGGGHRLKPPAESATPYQPLRASLRGRGTTDTPQSRSHRPSRAAEERAHSPAPQPGGPHQMSDGTAGSRAGRGSATTASSSSEHRRVAIKQAGASTHDGPDAPTRSSGPPATDGGGGPKPSAASNSKTDNPLYKTELCKTFRDKGACPYGSRCQFAHGDPELRSRNRHPRYKTVKCRTFSRTGHCPYGDRCRFIHRRPGMAGDTSSDSGTEECFGCEDEAAGADDRDAPEQQQPCATDSAAARIARTASTPAAADVTVVQASHELETRRLGRAREAAPQQRVALRAGASAACAAGAAGGHARPLPRQSLSGCHRSEASEVAPPAAHAAGTRLPPQRLHAPHSPSSPVERAGADAARAGVTHDQASDAGAIIRSAAIPAGTPATHHGVSSEALAGARMGTGDPSSACAGRGEVRAAHAELALPQPRAELLGLAAAQAPPSAAADRVVGGARPSPSRVLLEPAAAGLPFVASHASASVMGGLAAPGTPHAGHTILPAQRWLLNADAAAAAVATMSVRHHTHASTPSPPPAAPPSNLAVGTPVPKSHAAIYSMPPPPGPYQQPPPMQHQTPPSAAQQHAHMPPGMHVPREAVESSAHLGRGATLSPGMAPSGPPPTRMPPASGAHLIPGYVGSTTAAAPLPPGMLSHASRGLVGGSAAARAHTGSPISSAMQLPMPSATSAAAPHQQRAFDGLEAAADDETVVLSMLESIID